MTEDDLIALIEGEEQKCISARSGLLAEQRREALQYYYGQPYGNEVEGRSQVVTTEVKDAVEGILPSLMAIFTSTDEVVRFEPQGKEDDAVAQQATDYVNYIFSRVNNGFVALYCLFKDALLLKNGYLKVYWEDYEDATKESYKNLTEVEFASLVQDPELELTEAPEVFADESAPQTGPQGVPPQSLYNAVFRRTKKYGKVCIDPVPPEEILVSRDCPNDLAKARFVEHRTKKTISQVREMGYKVTDDIADFSPNTDFNQERVERQKYDDSYSYRDDSGINDPASREVWLCEAYLKVDFDEDGIAEFRKVTKIGTTILDNEEFDSLPVVGGTAILMPHKHYGLSLHDLVKDIQIIKSTITRQLLDNAYVANNGRMEVLDGMVNMEDLLTSRPNGIVRVKTLGAMKRVDNPLLGPAFYGLLEYFDKLKQNRVGATDFPNAVDPDAINAKAAFVDAFKAAAMERVHLMARILAEGPVKALFWKILELVSKHQQKPQIVKLKGRWVPVDPREWHNRFNMTVTVGLGTGSQQTVLNGAMGIMNIQAGMLKAGMGGRVVSEQNMYEAARRYAKAVFPKDADTFFTNPATLGPPPPPPPSPDILKIQLAAQKASMGNKQKYDKMMMDYQLALKQMGLDAGEIMVDADLRKRELSAEQGARMSESAMQAEDSHRDRLMQAGMQQRQMRHEHIQGELDRQAAKEQPQPRE